MEIKISVMLKFLFICLSFPLVQILTIVSARDAPPIHIPGQGMVMGTYLKMYRTQNIKAYLGIQYAFAPRFAPPVVDGLEWKGVKNATTFPPDCWQNPKRPIKRHSEIFQNLIKASHSMEETKGYDEECLFVNIFIPDGLPPMQGYAVIAWLHSGDFSYGSATDLDPFQMVFKQKVIVVTIAYRLNIFGFLTTQDGEAPGNFGLMDQAAALYWIRQNIKLFGGNENEITLMGHAAGSISVGLHLTSGEWSQGVFNKAIMMSGSPLADSEIRLPIDYSVALDSIANTFGCFRRPTSKLMECLRRIDAKILSENLPFIEWGPIVDEGLSNTSVPFIPDFPKNLIEKGMVRKVPLLTGYTDMEEVLDLVVGEMMDTSITNEVYETMLNDIILTDLSQFDDNDTWCGNVQIVLDAVKYVYKPYPPMKNGAKLRKLFVNFHTDRKYIAPTMLLANMLSDNNQTYVYRFDLKPRTEMANKDISDWVGVPQNFDLIFVWGIPYWTNPDMINQWDSTDKRISDIVMTLWANFVKSSNPTATGVYIKWDWFTSEEQKILVIDRAFNMTDDMNLQAIKFWNDYYPRVVYHAINCCNSTDTGTNLVQQFTGPFSSTLGLLNLFALWLNAYRFIGT
ncbi:cholinesterase 1 [Episyrphus balteatus]|uniref:cholinesterase 1 n=1 Tax=Episyrphus balteatus TaxID=286459 RepID=UPI002485736F|nr:cholinesterase 1 [Episyrphus balteatus]